MQCSRLPTTSTGTAGRKTPKELESRDRKSERQSLPGIVPISRLAHSFRERSAQAQPQSPPNIGSKRLLSQHWMLLLLRSRAKNTTRERRAWSTTNPSCPHCARAHCARARCSSFLPQVCRRASNMRLHVPLSTTRIVTKHIVNDTHCRRSFSTAPKCLFWGAMGLWFADCRWLPLHIRLFEVVCDERAFDGRHVF